MQREFAGRNLNISATETCTDILEYMVSEEKIMHTTQVDDHLNKLTPYMINGWPSTRSEVKIEIKSYWPF